MQVRSRSHYCSGKAINITYSECVLVALGTQHEMRVRHTVICGLPASTTFFHIISNTTRFRGGGGVIEHKVCVLIFSITFVLNIRHSCPVLMKLSIF